MAKPKNERKTESLVRDQLRDMGYYEEDAPTYVEEQKTANAAAQRLLRAASKSGKGGIGAPEFIVSSQTETDLLLIVECKADPNDHASPTVLAWLGGAEFEESEEEYTKRVQRYAVDGVLHYARALSKDFNVIAVAVSGETEAVAQTSVFLHPKGAARPKVLTTKARKEVDRLVPWRDFVEHASFDPAIQRLRHDELMAFARDLHEFMRNHAKLTESEKPLLVSGTLIALRNQAFAKTFDLYSPTELQAEWLRVIGVEIDRAEMPHKKKGPMIQPYSSIAVHPELGKATKSYPRGVLNELIRRLNEKVWPFISALHDFDVVGQFYGEFLKYTGGDKKGLGIVLTPRHITEVFALLANVTKTSKVLDICAGTGGFLVAAMHRMMRDSQTEEERETIRKHNLIGVEQQPNMFALAASNMLLRGDGKANLYQGSCFDPTIVKWVKAKPCTVGMLNPPFSQDDDDEDLHELVFVKHMLDCLAPGATGITIVPMSCATTPHVSRGALLREHTLEAVMSMPENLFYPVGTITCIMVFTAHTPHAKSNRKTWFGYWKDDGFVRTKHRGRVDLNNRWPGIRDRWVEMFRNREVHAGESVLQKVGAEDEWCAEAYMETDYTQLTQADFEKVVRNFAVFRLLHTPDDAGEAEDEGVDDEAE